MLIANLTNEVSVEIPINFIEKEVRVMDCFHIQSHTFEIGAKSATFQVLFLKKKIEVANPASTVQNEEPTEPITKIKYDRVKGFMVNLNEEELSTWGTNDEVLLHTIATKLGVEIESFTYQTIGDIV